MELLEDLIKNKFEIIITGVAAYPLGKDWIGRKLDKKMIKELVTLNKKYKINPAGEGGEAETFVLNSPLFKKPLKIKSLSLPEMFFSQAPTFSPMSSPLTFLRSAIPKLFGSNISFILSPAIAFWQAFSNA